MTRKGIKLDEYKKPIKTIESLNRVIDAIDKKRTTNEHLLNVKMQFERIRDGVSNGEKFM